MINILREDKDSEVLVVTPLLPGHKISKETKVTIRRNNTPITWITSEGNNNIPTNVQSGMYAYRDKSKYTPKYILPLDRDISLGRGMIDKMVLALNILPSNVAYTYANFEFKGTVNQKFPAQKFDINRLVFNNYISSNSLIKIECLDAVGGFVTDDKYKRLLDWAMWLKFYQYGYIGMPCPIASFVATSSENDVSAGTVEDFRIKKQRVITDFVTPIIDKAKKEAQTKEIEPLSDVLTFG
jgi:hypothetical protein